MKNADGHEPLLHRRDALKHVAIATTVSLSGDPRLLMTAQPVPCRRVLVIGAGFAGLACAYELNTRGYDVQVLEARDRVGGRVHSLKHLIPGKNIEAGGEFLGSNHPHALAYAKKFGFEFLEASEDPSLIRPVLLQDRLIPSDEQKQFATEVRSALRQMTELARGVETFEPWNSVNAAELDRRATSDWINGLSISETAKALLEIRFSGANGVATAQQSLLANLVCIKGHGLEKYWTDTEVYRLRGGNQQYATRFAEEIGPDRVTLNSPVAEIRRLNDRVIVIDGQGIQHQADDVVLAVPPSAWSRIKFTPALPDALSPQMGQNVKFIAVTKTSFWKGQGLAPSATTDRDVNSVWHATDGQGNAGHEALIAFSGASRATINHNRIPEERQPAYLKLFELLYPGFRDQFVHGEFIDWLAEPWTRAGYSFPAPGEITTIGPILKQGLGRLHFAGEHTCYEFIGYMEGALTSGATLARRLATRDGIR